MYHEYEMQHDEKCDCKRSYISIYNVIDGLSHMKNGKRADEDEITAEHFHNAPVGTLVRLTALCNAMLKHSLVPN